MAATRQRGKGYEIRVSLGYDVNGKKLSRSMMWTPAPGMTARQIEKELERQKVLFEEQAQRGLVMSGSLRFADFADLWLKEYSAKNHSPTTHARYIDLLKRINAAIGHIKLDRLRPNHLMAFYSDMEEQTNLSPKTIQHHHRLISAMLNTAVKWQVIPDNVAARVAPPKVIKHEAQFMEEDTVIRVFDLLEQEDVKHRTMIYLLLYTGMRRGELCGLEWHDIDWTSGTIKIERTSQYIAGQGIITKPPKTASGTRTVSVPPTVTQLLKHYRAWQSEEHLKIADRWQDGDRLFTQWDGKPIHPDTVSQWFDSFLKRHDLPHVTLHEIRHTNASHLIGNGVDVRTVAQRLGHSQVSVTLNTYAHSVKAAEQAAAVTLENSWNAKRADA
ncbi:hypothetical protein FACS1894208_10930 [Clostridia bacterium]|nr:hypothetical protein FACS1894208_10930 [Clostridia bacterium]